MKITCSSCATSLGEIRDAKLKKNMSYLCHPCEEKRRSNASRLRLIQGGKSRNPINDLFDGFLKW